MQQVYDGDGLRVKKVENGTPTFYLRSTVLGGQIVAELNGSGGWMKGYVYLGSQLLAVQRDNSVSWMHEDPITKSKRVTNSAGAVVSTIETDPWGADTNRSSNAAFQPRKYTSYDRDNNGTDEAMFRRYNRWQSRFDQPDPYDGGYDSTDPQSFNRYAYVQNDPVNFVDPDGLKQAKVPCPAGWQCESIWTWAAYFQRVGGGGGGGIEPGEHNYEGGKLRTRPQNPTTDIDKTWSREFDCNRSANDLFRTLRRDFSKFANLAGALAGGLGTAGIHFEKGPITEGRTIGIRTGVISNVAVPGTSILPSDTRQISVTVQNASTTSFTFRTNAGPVLYPGTISFAANDAGPGRVGASVTAKGNFADRQSRAFFNFAGGKEFENKVWNNFLDNLQRSCGSLK